MSSDFMSNDALESTRIPANRNAPSLGHESCKRPQRILLVDDEPIVARVEELIIKHLGYEVTATTDTAHALDTFRDSPASFDLVITDQMMPQTTGIEFAREIHFISPETPILMTSGYCEKQLPENCASFGISAFVGKPILIENLAAAIRKALEPAD